MESVKKLYDELNHIREINNEKELELMKVFEDRATMFMQDIMGQINHPTIEPIFQKSVWCDEPGCIHHCPIGADMRVTMSIKHAYISRCFKIKEASCE